MFFLVSSKGAAYAIAEAINRWFDTGGYVRLYGASKKTLRQYATLPTNQVAADRSIINKFLDLKRLLLRPTKINQGD